MLVLRNEGLNLEKAEAILASVLEAPSFKELAATLKKEEFEGYYNILKQYASSVNKDIENLEKKFSKWDEEEVAEEVATLLMKRIQGDFIKIMKSLKRGVEYGKYSSTPYDLCKKVLEEVGIEEIVIPASKECFNFHINVEVNTNLNYGEFVVEFNSFGIQYEDDCERIINLHSAGVVQGGKKD